MNKIFYFILFLLFTGTSFGQIIQEIEPNDDISQSGVITLNGNDSFAGVLDLNNGDSYDVWGIYIGAAGDLTVNLTDLSDIILVEWLDPARSNNSQVWYLATGSTVTLDGSRYYGLVIDAFSANYSDNPYQVDLSMNTGLPVELEFFEVSKMDKEVLLSWKTASEVYNDYFEIQRSKDGEAFESIGRVSGAGTTEFDVSYEFLDDRPLAGQNFYRLKQVDFDGTTDYSDIKMVAFESQNVQFSLFPNPATDYMIVELPIGVEGNVHIEILRADGKLIRSQDTDGGLLNVRVDLSNLISGSYMLRFTTEQGLSVRQFTVIN